MRAHVGVHWRRLTVLLGAGLIALGISVAAAPSAARAADDPPVTLRYSVTEENRTVGADLPAGAPGPRTGEHQVLLSCVAEACQIVSKFGFGFVESGFTDGTFAVPGTATLTQVESGSACDIPNAQRAASATFTFTSTGMSGTARYEPMTAVNCPDGATQATYYGTEVVILSSALEEGACYFTAEGCSVSASSDVPINATDGSDVGTGGLPVASGSSSHIADGDAAAPSILSTLVAPANAGTAPLQLGFAALLTIVLVLLIAFPTALLNSAVETGTGRLDGWRRARVARGVPAATSAPVSRPWWWACLGIVLAAFISAFIDPGFGFNPGSMRVVLSILVSFVIDVGLGWVLVIWLMHRANPGATHSFVFRPVTLLVVVAAVVFCRLTGFEPGIVFGLVAGVAFGAMVGKAAEARAVLVTLGYAFGVAVVAWLLFGALGGGASGESVVGTFMSETLASLAIGGMAALPVALFPVRGMAGHTLWMWSRRAWAAAYAVGLFAFFVVLMPMPFAWDSVGLDLWAWIGIYLAYAIGAVTIWLLVTKPWARPSDAAQQEETPEPEVASRLEG